MYLMVIITQSWASTTGGCRKNFDDDFYLYGLGSSGIVILLLAKVCLPRPYRLSTVESLAPYWGR
jgi:hypothetical protein